LGKTRRDRSSQFDLGKQFRRIGESAAAKPVPVDGVEFTGAAENNTQPGGVSQQLLGVDAVREFNLLPDSYSSEYGKRPGA
jgi:hypothetical protein